MRWFQSLDKKLPDTLFGRLALLLVIVALVSHALALSLLFELRPPPPENFATLPNMPPPGMPPEEMLADIAVRLTAVLLAAWIGARWLSTPMRRLADETRALARNIRGTPVREDGTKELREAAAVINQLQQHICDQLDERDRFVAAVSHDLRTPLTRMALRVESLTNEVDRAQLKKDIHEMNAMITTTLDYLRGAADPETSVSLDLSSFVSSLVHDYQDAGQPVTWAAPLREAALSVRIDMQVGGIRRCMENLVENAIRYGGVAEISIEKGAKEVHVLVCDKGPGIPDDCLTKVLQPFVRLESSRNRHTGGVGLGLAAANDIARKHGGSLSLRNRVSGGLCAELIFPLLPA